MACRLRAQKGGILISVTALTSCASGLVASLAGGVKPLFELRPGPFVQDEFVVLELHGQEAISSLSCFEVTVANRVETAMDLEGLAKDAFGTLGKAVGLGSAGRAVGGLFGQAAESLITDAEATALEILILGQPATLIIHSQYAPPRIVQGICTEIERLGPLGVDRRIGCARNGYGRCRRRGRSCRPGNSWGLSWAQH